MINDCNCGKLVDDDSTVLEIALGWFAKSKSSMRGPYRHIGSTVFMKYVWEPLPNRQIIINIGIHPISINS